MKSRIWTIMNGVTLTAFLVGRSSGQQPPDPPAHCLSPFGFHSIGSKIYNGCSGSGRTVAWQPTSLDLELSAIKSLILGSQCRWCPALSIESRTCGSKRHSSSLGLGWILLLAGKNGTASKSLTAVFDWSHKLVLHFREVWRHSWHIWRQSFSHEPQGSCLMWEHFILD